VLVAAMAFNDVQLSDNGKLHVMFSAMKGHVIVDSRLNDGNDIKTALLAVKFIEFHRGN